MSEQSKIEWTEASWNPIRARREGFRPGWACVKVSPGCANCYAERMNKRAGTQQSYTAHGLAAIELELDERTLLKPLRWKRPRRIFVCSMTDPFGEWVPDEWIDRVFAVMAFCPQHTFQVLTKRPARMQRYLDWSDVCLRAPPRDLVDRIGARITKMGGDPHSVFLPLPNVWLGVSCEDQQTADERIPLLLQTPAAVRFVSYEPALAAVDFHDAFYRPRLGTSDTYQRRLTMGVEWLIVGGESGGKSRPCDVAWIRSALEQCHGANVPCFVKQLGSRPIGEYLDHIYELDLRDSKGGDPDEWPADLRAREYPESARSVASGGS